MSRLATLALVALALSCGPGAPRVVIEVLVPEGLDAAGVTWDAPGLAGPSVQVTAPAELVASHPAGCPQRVVVDGTAARIQVQLRPLLVLAGPPAPVGFDTPFRLEAQAGCAAAEAGKVTFAQVEGPPLPRAGVEGRAFFGRTHALADLRPGPLPWGLVPLSEAQRGVYVVAATWRAPGHAEVTARATVRAGARATGVPSLAVATPVILGGDGWHLTSGPPGSSGALAAGAGSAVLRAMQPGRYVLADGGGRELSVRVGRYDETPLDCGRAECHPAATTAAAGTRMTTVLARGLDGAFGPAYDPRCALACHAVGEAGLADGGFVDLARELERPLPGPTSGGLAALPRALRRLAGVACTTCHGPAAIPEEAARWSILRADVCAVCHDAPPRYVQVAGWRASRMARADATAGTAAEGCRDCHTTAGFLAAQGIRKLGAPVPDGIGPLGVACAACHAPHGGHGPRRLLRTVSPPAALADAALAGESAVCLPCHAPRQEGGSSAAALWLGRGGRRVADGTQLVGAAPHVAVPCAGCHDGVGHTFAVRPDGCVRCHLTGTPATDATIAGRARALAARLGVPGHPRGGPTTDAAWDVALVLEDPAAAVHNPAYARQLLEEAERSLTGRSPTER